MSATRQTQNPQTGHWPGEPGLWSMLGGDMTVFGLMFCVFTHDRAQNTLMFAAGRRAMDQGLGLLNTLLLLASSWFVAASLQSARSARLRPARGLLACALLCAIGFCIVKFFEYREKIALGMTPVSNLFFTYYFALTGIHLVHVFAAIGVMGLVLNRIQKPAVHAADFLWFECAASFWHLVDCLWIMLFALFYLTG